MRLAPARPAAQKQDGAVTLRAGLMCPAVALLSLLFALTGVAEDEVLDGEKLYTERGCVYCHGPAGKEPALPEYPKLDGQNKDYLVQQMQDIKSRARDNGYTGMMQPAVLGISDEEFAVIAAFLAEQ